MKHLLLLLLFISTLATAETKVFGYWKVDIYESASEVLTFSKDPKTDAFTSTIGIICNTKDCIAYLYPQNSECVIGSQNMIMLIGKETKASEAQCINWEGRHVYKLLNEEVVLLFDDDNLQATIPQDDNGVLVYNYITNGFTLTIPYLLKHADEYNLKLNVEKI